MPSRTAVRRTAADVYELVETQVVPRLDRLEDTVKTAGLNGHSELLKAFLDREAKRIDSRKAYEKVGHDLRTRFRFLAVPRNWLKALFYAALGGLGWKIVSSLPPVHF